MEAEIKNFRDLKIWQKGKLVAIEIYKATENYPKSEIFGLRAQMRRAAILIASNIAEGFNRHHTAEYRQYLYIALGSCSELETQIEISHDLGYIEHDRLRYFLDELEYESKMLRKLISRLNT